MKWIDGFSESMWKSLLVKSERMGWLEGVLEAEKRLPKSKVQQLLISGVFEDIWPHQDEIYLCIDWIKEQNYEPLLAIQTHHGKGLTPSYHSYHDTTDDWWYHKMPQLIKLIQDNLPGIYVGKMALGNAMSWIYHKGLIKKVARTVDKTPFTGIKPAFADQHTYEGKKIGTLETILCGHPDVTLGMTYPVVRSGGWEEVRRRVHAEPNLEYSSPEAFWPKPEPIITRKEQMKHKNIQSTLGGFMVV